jgi:hypothetical protein
VIAVSNTAGRVLLQKTRLKPLSWGKVGRWLWKKNVVGEVGIYTLYGCLRSLAALTTRYIDSELPGCPVAPLPGCPVARLPRCLFASLDTVITVAARLEYKGEAWRRVGLLPVISREGSPGTAVVQDMCMKRAPEGRQPSVSNRKRCSGGAGSWLGC